MNQLHSNITFLKLAFWICYINVIIYPPNKICTGGCFTQACAPRCATKNPHACLHATAMPGCRGSRVQVSRLSAIHFQGWSIRQVSCYTLLSGFRLPWPPSCCQNEPTPFMVSSERAVGHLNRTLGSSLIASSAYQKWPTKNFPFVP